MRVDLGETEQSSKFRRGTEALLASLIEHHDYNSAKAPARLDKPAPLQPLPPIPNTVIAQAAEIAFPAFALAGTIRIIMRATAEEFSPVTMMDITSQRRTAKVVKARQVAMYLSKEMTARSLPEIGRRFGRDHTTVLHAVRKIKGKINDDPILAAQVDRIMANVEAR